MENVQQKGVIKGLILLVSLVVGMGGLVHEGLCQPAMDLNQKVKMGQYVQKVDNFMVILDASDTMNTPYQGRSRWKIARDVVLLLNRTIPDIPVTGALRKYSDIGNYNDLAPTALAYGPTKYSRSGFEQGLNKIRKAEGNSPLHFAISAATKDLAPARGDIAVIIVSDGAHIPHAPVLKAADNMKRQFGDRICIYTIWVGDDAGGKDLLRKVAQTGKCGFFTSADSIASEASMADFVEKVFLAEAKRPIKIPDSDGDGVPDDQDRCPNTPRGVKVDKVGCPLDSDGDGVPDYLDKCPNTPRGVKVDKVGCPLDSDGDGVLDSRDKCPNTPKGVTVDERGCWTYAGALLFDFNKWDLKPEVRPALDNAVRVLKESPGLKVEIQGHTDNVGSAVYNQRLSVKRAQSVFQYLVDHGIEKSRLSVKGYGLSKPAYSNDTKEGQAKNRRVEFAPVQ